MTLAALIRKRDTGALANATPAKVANDEGVLEPTLAGFAELALAKPAETKALTTLQLLPAGDSTTFSTCWLVHYADREPVKVNISTPGATRAEIMAWKPEAIEAEPFEPTNQKPTEPLPAEVEKEILAWLAHIDEAHPAIIADVLNSCALDADSRDFILKLQKENRHANN